MALITSDFVFIHVPRTGGTFCRSVFLKNYPDAMDSNGTPANNLHPLDAQGVPIPPEQHASAVAVERRMPDTANKRFIGFVRHPLTWYRSMWAWAMATGFEAKLVQDDLARRHWLAGVWSSDFREFIDHVIAMKVPRAFVLFHERLTRRQGFSEVGRYETLAADIERLTGCRTDGHKPIRVAPIRDQLLTKLQEQELLRLEHETVRLWFKTL